MSKPRTPVTASRLLSLILGPLYLLVLADLIGNATRTPVVFCVALITAGSIAVMAAYAFLVVRARKHNQSVFRFSLASVFVVVFALSVYFSLLSWIIRNLSTHGTISADWSKFAPLIAFVTLVTLEVLVWIADTIIWLAGRE